MNNLQEHQSTFLIISRHIHLRMRNVSYKSCREKQNTHFVFSNFFENRAVYEIMWKATHGNMTHVHRKLDTSGYNHTLRICNTGLFISPSGISELDCATTKTDTAVRSISICRESLQVFLY